MSKIWYWTAGAVGVATLLMLWWLWPKSSAPGTPGSFGNNLPQDIPYTPYATSTPVATQPKDFLADPATVQDPLNKGYYYLGYHVAHEGVSDPTATPDPPYIIEYIAQTQYFNIALLKEPIKTTREEAERYLLEHLSITKDQACNQLKYMVSVPYRINQFYSSMNLGFSLCQGAVQL